VKQRSDCSHIGCFGRQARIRPIDAPAFIVAQFLGAAAATLLFR
jgi:glycerol uptake facilitator-like aquaporin